jgi:hypothetical protein
VRPIDPRWLSELLEDDEEDADGEVEDDGEDEDEDEDDQVSGRSLFDELDLSAGAALTSLRARLRRS